MGSRTKTLLPTSNKLPLPKTIPPQVIKRELTHQQTRQKWYYDRNAKPLPQMKVGNRVQTQLPTTILWKRARIIALANTPRSYIVTMDDNQRFKRNRKHIRPEFELKNQTNNDYQTCPSLTKETADINQNVDGHNHTNTDGDTSQNGPNRTNTNTETNLVDPHL